MYNWNQAQVIVGPLTLNVVYNMPPHSFFDLVHAWVNSTRYHTEKDFCQYVADMARTAGIAFPWEDDKREWVVIPLSEFETLFKKYGYDIHNAYRLTVIEKRPPL